MQSTADSRFSMLSLAVAVAMALCLPAANATAQTEDIEELALLHIESGRPDQAIDLLRGKADGKRRALLLARAYLDDGNDFWAMRTLHDLAVAGEDCLPHLWLAFALFRQGAVREGLDLLEQASCPERSALEARRLLLQALLSSTDGDEEQARQALRGALDQDRAFPEDIAALQSLRASLEEGYVDPLTGRLELHSGWTSNAMAGSPTDAAAAGPPPASGLASFTASARLNPTSRVPVGMAPSPVIDAELRAQGIGAREGRGQSYLQLSLRPALLFGKGGRWLLGYRLDSLAVLAGDRYDEGPLWFFEAHRAEVDTQLAPWLTAFGGAGYRRFRELRRTRFEIDGGLGAVFRPAPRLNLLGAITGRSHFASREVYDLLGATALVQADLRAHEKLSIRLGLMGSFDSYPSSEGFFVAEKNRRDLLGKLTLGLWLPRSRSGLRGGLTYELSHRDSTAPDYAYTDHRVLLRGQWAFSFDPRVPSAELPEGHVPLAWGLEKENGDLEESIQELLRQDEAVRAGSSCVE